MSKTVNLLVRTEGLHALADLALATKEQARLEQLLEENAEGTLSAAGLDELDALFRKIDELNVVKARAAVALKKQRAGASRGRLHSCCLAKRRKVHSHFLECCGYCKTSESLTVVTFEVEHIIPRSLGGLTEFENLCLACLSCNRLNSIDCRA